jgi:hypothetical protein
MAKPTTFEEAKALADQTYINFWEDKSNVVTKNWTQKDYDLITNAQYENVKVVTDSRRGSTKTKKRRKLPEGYDEYREYQDRINAGPLDFSSEETHKMLINPPSRRGYGKRQSWISEDDPLRQAVEAQADVMKDFLDDAGVPIVQKYEDLDGFKRPDSFRGEGVYLNTGTAAHIDWDAGLKRMQRYQASPDAELGTYSNVFVRPDPEGIAGPLAFVGAITGNPWLTAASSIAAGGDIKDAIKAGVKSYALNQVTAPVLEETFATLGIDADLLGIDPETFSDSMMEVQTTMLEGGSGTDALIGQFTKPLADKVVDTAKEVLPDVAGIDIDFDTPDIIKDIGDFALAGIEAVGDFVEPVAKEVVDVGQAAVDVVQEVTQPISDVLSEGEDIVKEVGSVFDDAVLQPVKEGVQAVTEPVVDVVDSFIDAVDSPLGALLETGGDLLGGMLGGGQGQQQRTASTPTEGLFDKELFKFDTEIKSTQEMLSPMMNLRKYG